MRYLYSSVLILILFFSIAHADEVSDLKQKIDAHNSNIQSLEKEIKEYQNQVEKIGKEANTLVNTINSLDLSKKKLEAEVKLTQNKISNQNLQIDRLAIDIGDKGDRIIHSRRVISEILKKVYYSDSQSFVETIVGNESMSQFYQSIDQLVSLQDSARDRIKDLAKIKTGLETNKKEVEKKRAELLELKKDLSDQTFALNETVKEKESVLKETKNTEANYKAILANKVKQKAQFEKELFAYESALKIAIDPRSLPKAGAGLLSWPLQKIRITQLFGQTQFSKRLYVSGSHGGVDFEASIGTPVMAALSGIVTETESNAPKTRCQYGKFVLIKHPNGLSTIYGHLSQVNVVPGQAVVTGERIGYSGNTGYATGPHLHFGLYATQGIRIISSLGSCVGVKTVSASTNAYLDPMLYL